MKAIGVELCREYAVVLNHRGEELGINLGCERRPHKTGSHRAVLGALTADRQVTKIVMTWKDPT